MTHPEHVFAGRTTRVLRMDEIRALLPLEACIELQRAVFIEHARGEAFNAPSSWLRVEQRHSWIKLLAGYVDHPTAMGIKVLARFPDNPPGMNLGSLITLFDPENGFPLAIMDGVYITAARTGAGAALATEACARPGADHIGVLGSGVVARYSTLAMCSLLPHIQQITVFSRDKGRRQAFVDEIEARTRRSVTAVDTPELALEEADIVVTGTNAPVPVLQAASVRPGMHINAMGIRTEIDPEVFRGARVWGDSREVALEDGKFSVAVRAGVVDATELAGEIGDVLSRQQPGRTRDDEVTIFDSAGLAVQDVACAAYVYAQALERNLGQPIDLGLADQP